MKVLLEITDAEALQFDPDKRYPVLKEFDRSNLLGYAKITKEEGKLYAEINTRFYVDELTPAIGYERRTENKDGSLCRGEVFAVGLSEDRNEDIRIPKVKLNQTQIID